MGKGGIIGKANEPTSSIAGGIWSLREQYNAITNNIWPGQQASALYAFTSFTFNNAGVTGKTGPSLAQCQSAYNTTTYPWLSNTSYFNATAGVQLWTVPSTGTYSIDAYGAEGGFGGSNFVGGRGARIYGEFSLTEGTKIKIVVGQMGTNTASYVGGGGGGTYVMKETGSTTSDIYVIAGGGGGGPQTSGYSDYAANGSSTTTASKGSGGSGGTGAGGVAGTSGGGGACYDRSGGGGGGLTGNGGSSSYGQPGSGWGGYSYTNGSNAHPTATYAGGFGGGGAGDWNYWTGGGGGGGYNGGGGGYYYGAGGGGSSYNNGTNQTNTAGQKTGHGQVIITKIV